MSFCISVLSFQVGIFVFPSVIPWSVGADILSLLHYILIGSSLYVNVMFLIIRLTLVVKVVLLGIVHYTDNRIWFQVSRNYE
jgi:hypothetical protein